MAEVGGGADAQLVELARKVALRGGALLGGHEEHLRMRLRLERGGAQCRVVHWQRPPADEPETLRAHLVLEDGFTRSDHARILWEEEHARRVLPERRQLRTQLCLDRLAQKRVGHPGEDASTVAGGRVATAAAAMGHAHEHRIRILHDRVAWHAFERRDHPHTAAVGLTRCVIQPSLALRKTTERRRRRVCRRTPYELLAEAASPSQRGCLSPC